MFHVKREVTKIGTLYRAIFVHNGQTLALPDQLLRCPFRALSELAEAVDEKWSELFEQDITI